MKRLAVVVSALAVVSSGCVTPATRLLFGSGWRAPAVPEVDSYIVDLQSLGQASSPEDVRAVLGEPPFQFDQVFDDQLAYSQWRYPIRSISVVPLAPGAKVQRQVVPAVALNIRLDAAGRVVEWGFFHPVTGARLEIRQSLAEADALFSRLCSPPRRIELEAALRPGTARDDVLTRMRWFGTVSTAIEQAQYRSLKEGLGETLIYYADHPSPIYVPSMHVVVTFNTAPEFGTALHFESTFGGCA